MSTTVPDPSAREDCAPDIDHKWRRFELQLANFQSISKAQSILVHTLGGFLGLVWGWKFLSSGGEVTIQMLGLTVKATGFWLIVPAALTILSLALLGAINVIDHAWTRVNASVNALGEESLFPELDTHKNFLDYIGYLSLWSKPVLPQNRTELRDRFHVELLLYPGLLILALWTTWHAWWELPLTTSNNLYIATCVGSQLACSFQFLISKLLTFAGIKTDRDGVLAGEPLLQNFLRGLKRRGIRPGGASSNM